MDKNRGVRSNSENDRKVPIPAESFRYLTEAIPVISWTAGPDGVLNYISPQFHAYTGITGEIEELLHWTVSIHPDDLPAVERGWAGAVQRGELYSQEFRMRDQNGDYRWFAGRATPMLGSNGEVLQWFGGTVDIEAQKQAELKLVKVAEAKDRFIAMLGHELRNPLAAIVTSYEVLCSENADESKRELAFELFGRQVSHLKRLVDDTLDMSRLQSDRLNLIRHEVELNDLLRACADDFRPVAENEGIILLCETNPEPLWVDGDAVRLTQCVTNLLSNAVKFTESGGHVSISSCLAAAGRASISVRDSGVGLEKNEIAKLFRPFEQGVTAGLLAKDGLGLGLAVVKRLVAMHEGEIRAESAGRHQGATFTIELPLIDQPAGPGKTPEPTEVVATDDSSVDILIVEDNASVSQALEILFELEGHEVRVAGTGTEAFECLAERKPEIVFCDLTLPGTMKGWDIAARICDEIPEAADRPVLVALSGHAQEKYVKRSLESGFERHIAKPPSPDLLRQCLADVILRRDSRS